MDLNELLIINHLEHAELNILSKGLSFIPTPTFSVNNHTLLLKDFNSFSNSVRHTFIPNQYPYEQQITNTNVDLPSVFIYRHMKCLSGVEKTPTHPYTTPPLETCIYNAKETIALEMEQLFESNTSNISNREKKALKHLSATVNPKIIIKPADKNLGIVILDTSDYVEQVLVHLSSSSYRPITQFPETLITKHLSSSSNQQSYSTA